MNQLPCIVPYLVHNALDFVTGDPGVESVQGVVIAAPRTDRVDFVEHLGNQAEHMHHRPATAVIESRTGENHIRLHG